VSDACLSEVDNLNRITIPAPLLDHSRIQKKAVFVGMFNRLELWSPDEWQSYLSAMEDVPIPSIADLSRVRIREVS
jgi:MraZ protein